MKSKSFEIIENELDLSPFSEEEKFIVRRIIHATTDPEFKEAIIFHEDAVPLSIENLRMGKDILVDVEMVKQGFQKDYLKTTELFQTYQKLMKNLKMKLVQKSNQNRP
ncbi:MAG: precorrin-8X methylmutase [Thermosulfidibacteraceae bacterium]